MRTERETVIQSDITLYIYACINHNCYSIICIYRCVASNRHCRPVPTQYC